MTDTPFLSELFTPDMLATLAVGLVVLAGGLWLLIWGLRRPPGQRAAPVTGGSLLIGCGGCIVSYPLMMTVGLLAIFLGIVGFCQAAKC